jgi:hypothetical protein
MKGHIYLSASSRPPFHKKKKKARGGRFFSRSSNWNVPKLCTFGGSVRRDGWIKAGKIGLLLYAIGSFCYVLVDAVVRLAT